MASKNLDDKCDYYTGFSEKEKKFSGLVETEDSKVHIARYLFTKLTQSTTDKHGNYCTYSQLIIKLQQLPFGKQSFSSGLYSDT